MERPRLNVDDALLHLTKSVPHPVFGHAAATSFPRNIGVRPAGDAAYPDHRKRRQKDEVDLSVHLQTYAEQLDEISRKDARSSDGLLEIRLQSYREQQYNMSPMTSEGVWSSEAAAGEFMRRTERSLKSAARPKTAATSRPMSLKHVGHIAEHSTKTEETLPRTRGSSAAHYTISRTGDWAFELRSGGRRGGRAAPLTAEERRNAAVLRMVGACQSCRKRRAKCDPGTPCNSCVRFYKDDLRLYPCTRTKVVKKAGSVAVGSIDDSNQSGVTVYLRNEEQHTKEAEAEEKNIDLVMSAREPQVDETKCT